MRILIVEDDKKIAKSLKTGLEAEGFAVDIAGDGEKGYDLVSQVQYDLIILDLMLPKMDGITLCKTLRSEEKTTPILMLTAKSEIEDKVEGLNTGADDYLTKPFSFDELLARIRSLLRRPADLTPTELSCGNLKVNTQTFSVTRNEVQINLSKKEFALLEFLIRKKNKILTKDEIIEHVWNYDDDILPNTVEVYIRYLRNKIDRPFKDETPLIKTMWGYGYKMEDPNV